MMEITAGNDDTVIWPTTMLLVSGEFALRPCPGGIERDKRSHRRRFSSAVIQLNAYDRSMGMGKFHYALKRRNVTVRPKAL